MKNTHQHTIVPGTNHSGHHETHTNLKSPLDFQNKENLVKKMEVGKRPFYSGTLARDKDGEEKTQFGGIERRDDMDTIDENTVGPNAGTPGAPGIDEGTG